MKLKYCYLILAFLFVQKGYTQSVAGSWYSNKNNVCIKFDSNDNSVVINEFFDPNVNSGKKIIYKKIGNKIKLTWAGNQTMFGWKKDIYWFKIDSYTENEMTLTLEPNKHKILDEIVLEMTNVFILTPHGCDEKWKNKK